MTIQEKSRALRKRMTEAEKIIWEKLRRHQFHGLQFRRQYPVDKRYVLDFYCAKLKLGIEIDGSIHREKSNHENDLLRTEALKTKGIQILRFTNSDVMNGIDEVLMKILTMVPPLHVSGEGGRGRGETPIQKTPR